MGTASNALLNFLNMLEGLVSDRLERVKDRGATAVEYGLMVALIAVAILATVTLLGTELNRLFTKITAALQAIT